MGRSSLPRVVYVSHNPLDSALVRSQVLPYLEGLRERGIRIDLVTYEAYGTASRPGESWWPVPRAGGAGLPAKAIDVVRGVARVISLGRSASLLHARSYVPGTIAAIAGALTRRPFVFDMRGFLPDEYVDARYWSVHDPRYRVLRAAERYLLATAAEIVVLTEAAARRLRSEDRFARYIGSTPITVIPCTVDLTRFQPLEDRDPAPTLLYTGTLGSFYELEPMLAVFGEARALVPGLRFTIVNRSEHEEVRAAVARMGLGPPDVVLTKADPADMPAIVARAHVGIALLRRAPSKLGSSPVKVAEYLACGLPVVVNAGLGDVDEQVRSSGAGHVMEGYGSADVTRAARAVARLVSDVASRARARALAEREYDLRTGVDRYAEVYRRVLARAAG